jgi:hypothetical protein
VRSWLTTIIRRRTIFSSDGNLYVASSGGNDIERFNAVTGAFDGIFVTADSGGLSQPTDMVFGTDDNLYVSGFGNNAVLEYNGTTGASMGTFLSGGGLYGVPGSPTKVDE